MRKGQRRVGKGGGGGGGASREKIEVRGRREKEGR